MEYITYILVVFGIMALCYVLCPEKAREHKLKKPTLKSSAPTETTPVGVVLNSDLLSVPIPWGWPGHDEHVTNHSHVSLNAQEVHGASESLHRFADRLLSEKQTIESREYRLKKDASMRALLEDRYGRAYRTPQAKSQIGQAQLSRGSGKSLIMEPLREVKTPWGW
jgi:hypothetical protein